MNRFHLLRCSKTELQIFKIVVFTFGNYVICYLPFENLFKILGKIHPAYQPL